MKTSKREIELITHSPIMVAPQEYGGDVDWKVHLSKQTSRKVKLVKQKYNLDFPALSKTSGSVASSYCSISTSSASDKHKKQYKKTPGMCCNIINTFPKKELKFPCKNQQEKILEKELVKTQDNIELQDDDDNKLFNLSSEEENSKFADAEEESQEYERN